MINKIQLVFCRHTQGILAFQEKVQQQPPLGLLTLASFIKSKFSNIQIQVIDELFEKDELIHDLDADIIGFSVWFSNYENAIILAEKVKNISPNSVIIFGGPHVTALGKNILMNNPFIDYIILGEGEIPFYKFIKGINPELINGIYGHKTRINNCAVQLGEHINLDELPLIDMNLLNYKYTWETNTSSPSMSGFPLAGIRGCNRHKRRCEYCSIPFSGYRNISATSYWNQIYCLYNNFGINFFFETGDTFSKTFMNDLLKTKPTNDFSFRIYGYPGLFDHEDIKKLKSLGVRALYMGVESVLHWQKRGNRKYKKNYSINNIINEVNSFREVGIDVIPGFLLGLPGENDTTLNENIKLIEQLLNFENIKEVSINIVLPLPGTDYFKMCTTNKIIINEYYSFTHKQLLTNDLIDYYLLSKLFTQEYCSVAHNDLTKTVNYFKNNIGAGMTNWNTENFIISYTI